MPVDLPRQIPKQFLDDRRAVETHEHNNQQYLRRNQALSNSQRPFE